MIPQAAYNKMIHGEVEEVALDDLSGRVLSTMIVPYPPGIPLIMAGERITPATQAIVDYLRFCEDWDNRFPGFGSDVHGVRIHITAAGKRTYKIDCIT
jgi:arginine decarboxylase